MSSTTFTANPFEALTAEAQTEIDAALGPAPNLSALEHADPTFLDRYYSAQTQAEREQAMQSAASRRDSPNPEDEAEEGIGSGNRSDADILQDLQHMTNIVMAEESNILQAALQEAEERGLTASPIYKSAANWLSTIRRDAARY